MGLKIVTIYEGLSSCLPALINNIGHRLTHVHYTNVEYSDDIEMQELLSIRYKPYPSHIKKSFDSHSFRLIHNHIYEDSVIIIDSMNLLLSNIYLSNNKPSDVHRAVDDVLSELASLTNILNIDEKSNSTLFLISADVSGDWEVRSVQGQAYQQQLNLMNSELAKLSDSQFILVGANFIPIEKFIDKFENNPSLNEVNA